MLTAFVDLRAQEFCTAQYGTDQRITKYCSIAHKRRVQFNSVQTSIQRYSIEERYTCNMMHDSAYADADHFDAAKYRTAYSHTILPLRSTEVRTI